MHRRDESDGMWIAAVAVVIAAIALTATYWSLAPGGAAGSTGGYAGGGGGGGAGGGTGGSSGGSSSGSSGVPAYLLQTYSSSVDGASLSYYEWLPTGYTSTSSYPLIVFLHGQGQPSDTNGGYSLLTNGGKSVIVAAAANGFITIGLNTRTGNGWYINSPYTGPQEQDVLDAIANEKALRNVSKVYMLGFSMGGVGSSAIVAHHPSMFAGFGIVEPCDDMFQVLAHTQSENDTANLQLWADITNGSLPSAGGYAEGVAYYISAARFFPQNYSGLKIYGVDGGNDQRCPDNPNLWSYEEGNDTFLTASCAVNATMNEPANCTQPLAALETAHPGLYHYRYVYEANGTHDLVNINGADFIAYLLGNESDGLVCAAVGGTPHAC